MYTPPLTRSSQVQISCLLCSLATLLSVSLGCTHKSPLNSCQTCLSMSSLFNASFRILREQIHDCNVIRLHLRRLPSSVYRSPGRNLTTFNPEQAAASVTPSASISPWNVTVLRGDQKRTTVTVADLERQRDGRERVVILGSGNCLHSTLRNIC